MSTTVTHRYETYHVSFDRYADNDRLALGFTDPDGYYWSDLTVNFPGVKLGEREVVINSNSADQELVDAAEQAGLFAYTGESFLSGFVVYHVAELSEAFYNLAVQEADK